MQIIKKVDPARYSILISRELRMAAVELGAGPPPHGGERHPDGDELIYVISGKVSVIGDSAPGHPCELGPGDMCIVPRGEWHKVHVLQPTRLIHITPGPACEHRASV
jgi:quercetin dioxygenase-like cupin family protein